MAKDEFWTNDPVAESSTPAKSGGDFWLSDPVADAAPESAPDTGDESRRLAARYPAPQKLGLSDVRANEAAQTARFIRTEPNGPAPTEKPVSVLQTEGMDQSKPWSFAEASRVRRAIDDAPEYRPQGSITETPRATQIGMDARKAITNPAARGVLAGAAGLGQVVPGMVQAGADLVGADRVSDFAGSVARAGQQVSAPMAPSGGNDKLVFDIANSITQTAPTLLVGLGGGPAMTTLFGQSAAQEYTQGRSAGLDGGTAAARAGIMAGAEVLGERFGFGEQMTILKGLAKSVPADELAPVFARQILKEIPGEQLTTLVQFLGDKYGPGAQNPQAALTDYLKQAGDTLKVTIGQSAVMGGAPVAANAIRQRMQRPVDRTPQIEALRKSGDETAAALIEQRQQKEQAAYSTEREASALAQINPEVAQRYREVRLTGAKTGDAVVQTAARWNFEQAAQMAGLSPKAQEAISAKLAEVPPEKAAAFVQKAVTGMVQNGMGQPFDGMDTIAQAIETQRDQMLDSVLATMNDIQDLEAQQDAPQDTAQGASEAASATADTAAETGVPDGTDAVSGVAEQADPAALNAEWQQFPEQTGTLSVPRAEMPQVKTVHRGPLVNFLNARGVAHEQVEVDPADLKPTQAEFSQTKVQEAADRDTDRSILISSDGYIIDGHHQALAKLENGKPVKAIRLDAPAAELLPLVREFPSSTTEQANVQDAPQKPTGTEAQAAPAQAQPAATGIDAALAGVPAATGAGDVQANGVTLKDGARITFSEQAAPKAFSSLVRGEFGEPKTLIATNDAGEEVGRLTFMPNGGPIDSFVREQDRRRGVGTALYDALEARGGKLPPVNSGVAISDDARAFRAARSAVSQPKRVDRAASLRRAEWQKNPLREFLGRHGLTVDLAKEFAPGRKERQKAMVGGYGPIFRKAGKNIDLLAQIAREEGFLSPDQDATDLYEQIAKVFRGERVAPLYAQGVAESEMEARMRAMQEQAAADFEDFQNTQAEDPFGPLTDDEIAATGYDAASDAVKAEVDALIAMAETMGIDTETLREDAARATADQSEQAYYEQAQRILKQAIGQGAGSSGDGAVVQPRAARAEKAQRAGDADRGAADGGQGQQDGVTLEDRPDGTLAVTGDKKALRERLTAAGIPSKSILPSATGVVVGKTQAKRARNVMEGRDADKAAPRTLDENGRATDGKPINAGDVFTTLSGRETTPYPKQQAQKFASQWLIDNAISEARARRDDFNATGFSGEKPLKDGTLADASRESMLMYLFGEQPAVVPSIIKPLVRGAPTLTAPTKADIKAQQDRAAQADKLDQREQIKRESEAGAGTFELTREDGRDGGTQPLFSIAEKSGQRRKPRKAGITAEQYDANLSAWANGAPKVMSDKADDFAFKSGSPVLLEAFHGTGRGDRVGTKFLKKRATSGPMSFFTSSPELAGGYATGKQDTSLSNEDISYADWFKYQPKGQRSPVPLDRAWYFMDSETKQRILERMPDIRTDDDGNIIYEQGGGDIGSYQWNLKQTQRGYDKQGNPLAASIETWLMSGTLFGEEQDFMKVLKLAGVPVADITYDNPGETFPFVYKTWVRMNRPLVTSDVPVRVQQALKAAALKDRSRAQAAGADMWDKNTRTLRDWVDQYFNPTNGDNKYVWTSIPDKVTEVFKAEGYDGIIDWSGKGGGATHPVYIPFEQNQVKSAIGNNGKFDQNKDDILLAIDAGSNPSDTADYGPATRIELTEGQRAAVARLQAVIRAKQGNSSYVLQPVEQVAGAGREFAFARNIIREAFGIEVTPVNQPGQRIFNGAQVGAHLLLDVKTQKPAMVVMGHELLHQLRREDPQLYSFLKVQIERVLKDGAADAYAKKLRARYEALGLDALNDDTSLEELLADIVGDQFGQREFWDAIGKKSPNRVVALARKVLEFFDKLLSIGRKKFPFETDQYLTDIEAAREIVADVLAEYSGDKTWRSAAETDPKLAVAYHGSPHRFDKFTTDKIGTGEGAQAFGWGLYFAGRKEIANWYKEKLSGSAKHKFTLNKVEVNIKGGQKEAGKFADAANALGFSDEAAALAWKTLQDKDGDLSGASSDLGWREKPSKWDEEAANILRQTEFVSEGGRLYKVEIPEESEMLLWDKPLSEQPAKVREALAVMDPDTYSPEGEDYDANETGQMVYQRLAASMKKPESKPSWTSVSVDSDGRAWSGQQAASEALLAAGVRGIKYMDGVSRNKALRDVKREFLEELPEDAEFDEVMDLVGTGAFSPKNDDVIKALAADDWLGFDYPAQAISAALSGRLSNYDASPALVQAVAATQDDSTYNYVVFSGDDVSIQQTHYSIADKVDQTETPAFKRWFGDSMARERMTSSKQKFADMPPLVMYHTTRDASFTAFEANRPTINSTTFGDVETSRAAIFFTPSVADSNAYGQLSDGLTVKGAATMPVYLKAENPLWLSEGLDEEDAQKLISAGLSRRFVYNAIGHWSMFDDAEGKDLVEAFKRAGYDSVVFNDQNPLTGDTFEAWAVFNPTQIKSAIGNRGTFDPNDADIRFSIADKVDQTETPEFKRWFAGSKVVDSAGKPLVVYHGTHRDFTVFDSGAPSSHIPLPGFYFSPIPDVANGFAESGAKMAENRAGRPFAPIGANVMPVFLSLRNPAEIDGSNAAHGGRMPSEKVIKGLIEKAKKNGHDGAIIKGWSDGSGPIQYVAFRPEQIKSATGNRGNFDPNDADIRFSIADKSPSTVKAEKSIDTTKPAQAEMFQPGFWDAPQETRLDKVIYELADGRIDLKRVQEAISKVNTIPQKFDARLAETLYPGRVATRAERFLNDEAKPLLDAMARNNVTMDELSDYLHARHAEERNQQIAKVNPDLPDGGAGKNSKGVLMTTEAAKQHIAALTVGKRMALETMAKRVDAITQGTTKLLVEEGLEKQETIDAWTGAYKSYVPLFRDEAENGNPHPSGTGMSVRGSSSKRAVGSKRQATNILAHVLMQREAAITRAEKNRVAVALYGLALTNPNPDFWTTIKPSMSPEAIGRELQRMGVDPLVAQAGMAGVPTIRTVDPVLNRVVDRPNPMYKSLPGAIVLKVKGEDRVLMVNVNDPRGLRMAENLKNLDGLTKLDLAGSVVGKLTRWMASVNTQYNPAFGLVNLTRDTLGGAINLSSTKLRGKTLKVLALTPAALKGIGLELAGKNAGEWGRLYRQFQADGGQTGYREQFRDANDRTKALEDELKALEKAGKLTPSKVADKMLGALDVFNTTMENAVRLAAYREALLEGMSRPEAARLGRELTVDFNRKGRATREVGPLYAFFNASVQGTARTMQTLAGPAGAKIIAGGLTLGVMQAIMLLAAGYDDDEIPEFVKSRALIIPLGKDEEGKKRFFSLPLPLGLHVLPNTGRVLAEVTLSGGKDAGKKLFDATGEIAGAFNPLGGGNVFTTDGFLKTIAPTVADPVIEWAANKNFAGMPIERERMQNDPRPGFQLAKENTLRQPTGQVYTDISRIINKATGGSDYEAGLASPTPEIIRHFAQVIGGGLLREVEKGVNTSIDIANGGEAKPTGLPVVGRFYGEIDDESVQRTRYFENLAAIEKAERAVKAAEKAGDLDAAQRIEDAKPEATLKAEKNKAQKDLRELSREAMSTVGDRQELKAIDQERTAVMRDLNNAAREVDQKRRDGSLGGQLRKALGLADVAP